MPRRVKYPPVPDRAGTAAAETGGRDWYREGEAARFLDETYEPRSDFSPATDLPIP